MSKNINLSLSYQLYSGIDELTVPDQELMQKAQQMTGQAYAPYSNFWVGAALRLKSGTIVTGSNQENAAYPSGLCAERSAFYWAGSNYPAEQVEVVAIAARHAEALEYLPITPCGACRQAMLEYENRQKAAIRLLMRGEGESILEIPSIETLLPFKFSEGSLKM